MSSDQDRPGGGGFLYRTSGPSDVFTPEDLPEEHAQIARTVDAFWENEVSPALPAIRRLEPGAARTVMRKAADLGLMALAIPEKYGGMELDLTAMLVVAERVARDASYMVWEGGQTLLGTLPILYFGAEEQKRRYLPKLARLEMLTAYALSESQSGSDALAVRTRADLNDAGTHYVLNGQKTWVTNAGEADLFIVFARAGGKRFTCFLVERESKGLTIGANEHKMGLDGSSTAALYLDDVHVPAENVLGEVGRGHVVAFNILNLGRLKLGASSVGAARDVLATSIRYAKGRRAFGSPISEFGAIRHKLAEAAIRIFAAESMVWRTAGLIEDGSRGAGWDAPGAAGIKLAAVRAAAAECSMVKVFGSETLDYVVDEGVQIHGGYGYHRDYAVERAYRDARVNRIFEGTNEINRLLIPRIVLRNAAAEESDSVAPDGNAERAVHAAKRLAVACIACTRQAFPETLESEQEVLMCLADVLIETYAMESSLLRARKIEAWGRSSEAPAMAAVFLADAAGRIVRAARTIAAHSGVRADLDAQAESLERLAHDPPSDAIALRRRIAARLIDHERYVV